MAVTDPTERLRLACQGAIDRYTAKEGAGVDPDVFPELGEALFWLIALAQAKGRHKRELLQGLGWARNRIAHGVLITAPVRWRYGSEVGRLVVGESALGTTSAHEWLSRDRIAPSRTQRRNDRVGEAAYDKRLAGQSVLDALRNGLAEALDLG